MRNKTKPMPSALYSLPETAAEDVAWAEAAVRGNASELRDVFAPFRERLETKGIEPPSFNEFVRHFVQLTGPRRQKKARR